MAANQWITQEVIHRQVVLSDAGRECSEYWDRIRLSNLSKPGVWLCLGNIWRSAGALLQGMYSTRDVQKNMPESTVWAVLMASKFVAGFSV